MESIDNLFSFFKIVNIVIFYTIISSANLNIEHNEMNESKTIIMN